MKKEFKKVVFVIFLKISLVILSAVTLGIPKLISKIQAKIQALTTEEFDN